LCIKLFRTLRVKRLGRKFFKITALVAGSLILLLVAFHFWIVHHAEEILQDLVKSKSNGKLKLEVRNFKFNWFSKKMELVDAVVYTTDSTDAGTSYRFAVKTIKLKVKAVLPMILEKKVMINDLDLKEPDILVTRLRASQDTTRGAKVSIPQEMGRIYNSIQDALLVLKVKKFEIENAKFTLVNRIQPEDIPVSIDHIDFHIDNFKVDTSRLTGKEKIFFSDNIVLKARDQDILLPDGRHRISFRKFRINIEKKIVEFDSCTIAAIKADTSDAAFSIYFDALQLTNIDFDALYRSEIIKADSVYCTNPKFMLSVDLGMRTGPNKPPPKLDEIIRQLTGNLALNYVIVNNASFDINTVRNNRPSSFTSSGNNFEMQGLTIDNQALHPLKVRKFALAIRNYENFLRDSTYEMRFDSVFFNDDNILLNDFSFRRFYRGNLVNTFIVPRFKLTGLSWEDLLFDQKLTAQQATLYDPVIRYIETGEQSGNKKNKNIFDALARINDVIMLEDLIINNGNINLKLLGDMEMQLDKASFGVESRSLLGSDQLSEIRRSVNNLSFVKGKFRIKDLSVQLDEMKYTGLESSLQASKLSVYNESGKVNAVARNVTMNEILINEKTGDISLGSIDWEHADIKLSTGSRGRKISSSFVQLTDITGKDTRLDWTTGNKNITTHINSISATAFILRPGEKPVIGGMQIDGRALHVSGDAFRFNVDNYSLIDQKTATLEGTHYYKYNAYDSTHIFLPRISFVPAIQSVIDGDMKAGNVLVSRPEILINKNQVHPSEGLTALGLPKLQINSLVIEEPLVNYTGPGDKGITRLDWNGRRGVPGTLTISEFRSDSVLFEAKQVDISLGNFTYQQVNGKGFDAGDGRILAKLNNIHFSQPAGETSTWKAILTSLEGYNFLFDSIGKKAGRLSIASIALRDLAIQSSSLLRAKKLIEENQQFRVHGLTGSYADDENEFKWHNAGYDKYSKRFSLDSFSYRPVMDIAAFTANHPFQTDYIQLNTGPIRAGPFDIDGYLNDSIIRIGELRIDDLNFTDYRDNRLPFRAGIIKPLFVPRILSIPIKLSIDSVYFQNANAVYSEVNPKTNQTGVVPVTRMTIRLFPVRNFGLSPTDSLRVQANGYLMDSMWLRLRLRESYTDSLYGFLLTLRMRGNDFRLLNPVLTPLVSAKLKSGWLDTLSMRVAGGEYMAFGEMDMRYHDLKIQVLKNGSEKKGAFLSFLANTFLVKNKNEKRISNVFYIRNREKSSMNYLVKILLSGVQNSVMSRNNKKTRRQYKKELRQRNLPPLDYD
jgi:hypothetical protein